MYKAKLASSHIILYSALVLFLSGLILGFILVDNPGELAPSPQFPFIEKLSKLSPLLILLLPVVVLPLIEEFTFRLWTLKSKASYVISVLSITAYVFLSTGNLVYTLITPMVLIVVFFFNKNILLTTFVTSLIFSFLHIPNMEPSTSNVAIALITLSGLSFLLIYIGLRFNLFYCILTHACYNLLVTLLHLSPSFTEDVKLENSSYSGNIEAVSVFSADKDMNYISPDSISITGNSLVIVEKLQPFSCETVYRSMLTDLSRFHLTATAKQGQTIDIDELTYDLMDVFDIGLDAVAIPAYTLKLFDVPKPEKDGLARMKLYDVVGMLKLKKKMNVKLYDHYPNEVLYLQSKVFTTKDNQELRELLYEAGIYLSEEEDTEMEEVRIGRKIRRIN